MIFFFWQMYSNVTPTHMIFLIVFIVMSTMIKFVFVWYFLVFLFVRCRIMNFIHVRYFLWFAICTIMCTIYISNLHVHDSFIYILIFLLTLFYYAYNIYIFAKSTVMYSLHMKIFIHYQMYDNESPTYRSFIKLTTFSFFYNY